MHNWLIVMLSVSVRAMVRIAHLVLSLLLLPTGLLVSLWHVRALRSADTYCII